MRPLCALIAIFSGVYLLHVAERTHVRDEAASRATSLQSAIAAFNARAISDPIGCNQTPLSVEEVMAAIEERCRLDRDLMLEEDVKVLEHIAATETLPPMAQLRKSTKWTPGGDHYLDVWGVWLWFMGRDGTPRSIPVREEQVVVPETPPASTAWGAIHSCGLQLGYFLVPSQNTYLLGSVLDPRIVLRNSGEKPLLCRMPMLASNCAFHAWEVDGHTVQIDMHTVADNADKRNIRLEPGELRVLYHAPRLRLGESTRGASYGSDRYAHASVAASKTYHLSLDVPVSVYEAGHVTLRSGTICFHVVERNVLTCHDNREFSRLQPLPRDELIGELVSARIDHHSGGRFIAGFRTVRGSTSSFAVTVTLEGAARTEKKFVELMKNLQESRDTRRFPERNEPVTIRIRTDRRGRPDLNTWALIRRSARR